MTGNPSPIELVWRTDRGHVRERNEDAVATDQAFGIVAIADGMGGALGGDVASRMAVEGVSQRLSGRLKSGEPVTDLAGLIAEAILETNAELVRAANSSPALWGMGTTLDVGVFGSERLVYGHAGDSRLYRWHGGQLEQLTRDHSLVQEVVDLGQFPDREAALRAGIPGNVVTRVLGDAALSRPDIGSAPLVPGDIYLFCTDGLTNLVDDEELAAVLRRLDPLEEAADSLVRLACDSGGYDNISLVLVRVTDC